MHPVLFRIPEGVPLVGGLAVNSFGFMLFLAFAASAFVIEWELRRKGRDGKVAWDMLFWALGGGLVGAKLYFALFHLPQVMRNPVGEIFSVTGFTWYGGFIGGALLVWYGLRRQEAETGVFFDSLAVALPLAIPIGRIGCLLAGDDYGRPTGSFLGIAFPNGYPPTRVDALEARYGITVDPELVARFGEVVPVHPTQLYEVGLSLLVFALIFGLRKHGNRAGWLFMVWMACYGVQRFLLEILRLKDDRVILGLSTAQILSVALLAGALVAMSRLSSGRGLGFGRAAEES